MERAAAMNTREPTATESGIWERFRNQFETSVSPKVRVLILLAKVGLAAQNKIQDLTGSNLKVIDEQTGQNIANLGRYAQIIENQITGVLVKKYAVKIEENELSIVGAGAPEGDIMPQFSGFGIAPILIAAGVAAVTLLAGGFITLKIIEERSKNEALRITERLTELDREMLKQPEEKRAQWTAWKKQTAAETEAAAKSIPGASGLLSRFLGDRGTSIAIAGLIAIAGAYLLIPQFRRN